MEEAQAVTDKGSIAKMYWTVNILSGKALFVNIVNAEDIAQSWRGFGQFAHALGSTGLFVRRNNVRMQVVVAMPVPAIEMSVAFFQALPVKFTHLFGADAEGSIEIVL